MASLGHMSWTTVTPTTPATMTTTELAARGLAEGEIVKTGEILVRRGGEHDAPLARGFYYATRGGLSLHHDGTWAAGLRRPGMAKPAPGTVLARTDLTGLWDDLTVLLSVIDV